MSLHIDHLHYRGNSNSLLLTFQTIRIIRQKKRYVSYQLIILYVAMVEMTVAVMHYTYFEQPYWDMIMNYLKLLQYVVIVYYFVSFALAIHNKDSFGQKYVTYD